MSAAEINPNETVSESLINKKRQTHTKTQKNRQNQIDFNPQKVNSVLESIHNMKSDDFDDSELGSYNPRGTIVTAKHSESFKPLNPFDFPDKPMSMGAERKKEGMTNNDNVPQPTDNEELKLQELQSAFMNESQVRDYYRKMSIQPPQNTNYQHQTQTNNNKNYYTSSDANQILIEKLNYMINLLEEQQDQKTNSATEEVVLYSFLGVFIIFIVDSFTKVNKYVR